MNLSRQLDYIEAELRGPMRLSELLALVEQARGMLPVIVARCAKCNLPVVGEAYVPVKSVGKKPVKRKFGMNKTPSPCGIDAVSE